MGTPSISIPHARGKGRPAEEKRGREHKKVGVALDVSKEELARTKPENQQEGGGFAPRLPWQLADEPEVNPDREQTGDHGTDPIDRE